MSFFSRLFGKKDPLDAQIIAEMRLIYTDVPPEGLDPLVKELIDEAKANGIAKTAVLEGLKAKRKAMKK